MSKRKNHSPAKPVTVAERSVSGNAGTHIPRVMTPSGVGKTTTSFQMQVQSGPLPPAHELIRYNEAVPNAAERIIHMAELQSAHRREMELFVVHSDQWRANVGLWMGGLVAIIGIMAGAWVITRGYPVSGSILSGGMLVTMVGTFVYGSQQKQKDVRAKDAVPRPIPKKP